MKNLRKKKAFVGICLRAFGTMVLGLCVITNLWANPSLKSPQRVTINLKDAAIKQVFAELRKQTTYNFVYSDDQMDKLKPVTLNVTAETVENVLNRILEGTPYTYAIEENSIVIVAKESMKKEVNPVRVNGKVKDKDGSPLPGVTVRIKGTNIGVATDMDGRYAISLSNNGDHVVLVYSFVGMEVKEIAYKGQQEQDVILQPTTEEMDEVVVTGIFTRKKESFTGSATTYSKKDLQKVGTTNVVQALKTMDPAFAVSESTEFGSDPNRLPNIEIRGKSSMLGTRDELQNDPNQPLFILDGFESTLAAINDLDINRIENITILKDAASTAIYGSKAANGVVVVETVKPKPGKLQVSYNGNLNVSMPDLSSYNLMNSAEKLEFEKLAGRYDASIVETPYQSETERRLTELYYERQNMVAEGVNTDWIAQPVKIGVNHKHSLYVMGGEEHFMFGIGGAYNGVSGVMKDSKRQVLSGNIDLIYRVNKFQFSNKFSVSNADYANPVVGFSTWAVTNPFYKMRNADGTIPQWLEYSEEFRQANPLWDSHLNSRDGGNNLELSNFFMAEWSPSDKWRVRGKFGITYGNDDVERFTSPEASSQVLNKKSNLRGEYYSQNTRSRQYEGELTVTFAQVFKEKHRLNLVAGGNMFSTETLLSGYTVEGFPAGDFTYPSFAGGFPEGSVPTYVDNISRAVNAFFNAGYSYDDRYLMDFSLRENGSSVFGSSNKFNTTWSVGLGWNIHREKFIRDNLPFLNYFKVRASIGNPGNQSFDSGRTLLTYSLQSGVLNYFGLGALPNQIGNPNLKWQITQDKNVGFDLTLFDNRFSVNFDYFHKVTDPLLISIDMPLSSGTESYYTNAGEQTSQGVNFSAVYHIFRNYEKRLLWSVRATGRTQKTKIDKIGHNLDSYNNNGLGSHTTRYFDGADPDDIWAVKSGGIDPATGKEIFFTKEGTPTYDFSYDNEVVCGNTRPDLEGVLGTSFTYKGLTVSLNFRYQLGADVLNTAVINKVENIDYYYNQDRRALYQRWQKPGDVVQFKNIRDVNSSPLSSRFVQTENVLSLESAHVEYEFVDGWVRKCGLSSMKAFVSMRDAFRLSTIRSERGTEYPFARTLEVGLSINF